MINKTYAENMSYLTCEKLMVSVVRGRSKSITVARHIKTEIDKKEKYDEYLIPEDVKKMREKVYTNNVEAFKKTNPKMFQERNERFNELDNELKMFGL